MDNDFLDYVGEQFDNLWYELAPGVIVGIYDRVDGHPVRVVAVGYDFDGLVRNVQAVVGEIAGRGGHMNVRVEYLHHAISVGADAPDGQMPLRRVLTGRTPIGHVDLTLVRMPPRSARRA